MRKDRATAPASPILLRLRRSVRKAMVPRKAFTFLEHTCRPRHKASTPRSPMPLPDRSRVQRVRRDNISRGGIEPLPVCPFINCPFICPPICRLVRSDENVPATDARPTSPRVLFCASRTRRVPRDPRSLDSA
jgi:hypothetical protein